MHSDTSWEDILYRVDCGFESDVKIDFKLQNIRMQAMLCCRTSASRHFNSVALFHDIRDNHDAFHILLAFDSNSIELNNGLINSLRNECII